MSRLGNGRGCRIAFTRLMEVWQSQVDCNSLENCRTVKRSVGSNPTASASLSLAFK